MAEIDVTKQLTVSLTVNVREALIQSLVDAIPKQFIQAVILRLMLRDEIARSIIMESMGEAAVKEHEMDPQGHGDTSWDDIALKVIKETLDTPGGRGEVE